MFGHDNQDDSKKDDQIIPQNFGAHDDHGDSVGHGELGAPNDVPSVLPSPTDDTSDKDDKLGGFVATPAAPAHAPAPAVTDDLLDIKHEALQALTPLVGQLDQTPEEQFRTTMMMIQASDNHALVKVAYDAAKKISNEKERAQALLDIVNEINYFTQQTPQA